MNFVSLYLVGIFLDATSDERYNSCPVAVHFWDMSGSSFFITSLFPLYGWRQQLDPSLVFSSPEKRAKLSKASSLSLSLKGFQTLIILVALCWTYPILSLSVSVYWENQSWTRYSRCVLKSVTWRGIITSLDLLAGSLLMQPSMQLAFNPPTAHCCLILNSLSIRVPQILFCKAAFHPDGPQSALLHGSGPCQG